MLQILDVGGSFPGIRGSICIIIHTHSDGIFWRRKKRHWYGVSLNSYTILQCILPCFSWWMVRWSRRVFLQLLWYQSITGRVRGTTCASIAFIRPFNFLSWRNERNRVCGCVKWEWCRCRRFHCWRFIDASRLKSCPKKQPSIRSTPTYHAPIISRASTSIKAQHVHQYSAITPEEYQSFPWPSFHRFRDTTTNAISPHGDVAGFEIADFRKRGLCSNSPRRGTASSVETNDKTQLSEPSHWDISRYCTTAQLSSPESESRPLRLYPIVFLGDTQIIDRHINEWWPPWI